MTSMNNNHTHSSIDIIDAYESDGTIEGDHDTGSIPYSKENIPIGHLSSHLETMGIDSGVNTEPPTPLPYYLNSTTEMRAMSDTSLFIPDNTSSDGFISDDNPLIPRSNTAAAKSWEERGAAKIVKTELDADGNTITSVIKKSVKDFKFGKSLGEGSYSTVVLATDKVTGKNYAMKVLDKRHIIREKKVKYVNIEKNTLNRLGKRDGIIHLFFTFQDEASLYFVLDYAPNGELLSLIKKYGTMNEESVKYYCAQILDGIKYMHDNGVVHRDIKPENILIDYKMRATITDFGTAKLLEKNENGRYPADVKANSFVGTAEYVSPELLNDKACGKPCDIWAFGCIMYQMIAGKPPFKATNEYLTFQKVCKLQYAFTAGFPLIIRDLIKKILVLNPSNRASIRTIQSHFFFSDINWADHDSLFENPPPELGPYKVSARSMMPVPELSQQSVTKAKVKRPQTAAQNSSSSLAPSTPKLGYEESGRAQATSASAPTTPLAIYNSSSGKTQISTPKNTKSASSAAAAALAKNTSEIMAGPNDSTESDITQPNSSSSSQSNSKRGSEPDLYIPGTNILRPVVKSRVISSSTNKSSPRARTNAKNSTSSSKRAVYGLPVSPMSQIDLAWVKFFKHPDERVLKVGHVLVNQTTTEAFEKKYKGMLAESPLGYNNGKRNPNTSSSSLLSQIANGQHPGLRRGNSANLLGYISTITEDENDTAIIYNFKEEEADKSKEKEKPEKGKFKKVFGGFGSSHSSSTPTNDNYPRDRTLLITSLGRALIFRLVKDKYELRTEIDLTNPSVKFKEIFGDRRVKNLITTGVFAIESLKITLMFEVEKQDIIVWTTALAKSKENQEERVAQQAIEAEMGSVSNASNALTAAAIATMKSPKAEAYKGNDNEISEMRLPSPTLTEVADQIKNYDLKTLNRFVQATKSPRGSVDEKRQKDSNQTKLMDSKLKRKPPPTRASKQVETSSSQGKKTKDNNLIAAAINTAINNPDIKPSSTNRASSFNRGGTASYFYPHDDSNDAKKDQTTSQKKPTTNGASKGSSMITGLNSRFLQRSHRKK